MALYPRQDAYFEQSNWPRRGKTISEEEFHELERLSPDCKYEYINGVAYMMSGAVLSATSSGIIWKLCLLANCATARAGFLALMCRCCWAKKEWETPLCLSRDHGFV